MLRTDKTQDFKLTDEQTTHDHRNRNHKQIKDHKQIKYGNYQKQTGTDYYIKNQTNMSRK